METIPVHLHVDVALEDNFRLEKVYFRIHGTFLPV